MVLDIVVIHTKLFKRHYNNSVDYCLNRQNLQTMTTKDFYLTSFTNALEVIGKNKRKKNKCLFDEAAVG